LEKAEAEVELIKGGVGEFKVSVDGEPIFVKRRIFGRMPEDDEILRLIGRGS